MVARRARYGLGACRVTYLLSASRMTADNDSSRDLAISSAACHSASGMRKARGLIGSDTTRHRCGGVVLRHAVRDEVVARLGRESRHDVLAIGVALSEALDDERLATRCGRVPHVLANLGHVVHFGSLSLGLYIHGSTTRIYVSTESAAIS